MLLEQTLNNESVELRAYQTRDVERIEQELREHLSVFYCLPTGGGKTVVMALIIERASSAASGVLVLTHRREILVQTSLMLQVEHGLIHAGLNVNLSYPVQIGEKVVQYHDIISWAPGGQRSTYSVPSDDWRAEWAVDARQLILERRGDLFTPRERHILLSTRDT